jgi:hypothetical protein
MVPEQRKSNDVNNISNKVTYGDTPTPSRLGFEQSLTEVDADSSMNINVQIIDL